MEERTPQVIESREELRSSIPVSDDTEKQKGLWTSSRGSTSSDVKLQGQPPYVYLERVKLRAYKVVGWRYGLGDVRRVGEE